MVSNRQFSISSVKVAGLLMASVFFAGCDNSNTPPSADAAQSSAGNAASFSLQGTPPTNVTVGSTYSFQPTVSASTTAVNFKITGQPAWAHFDTSNGALSGIPSDVDEGSTGQIVITAGNATSTASLRPFTIQVKPPGTGPGTATLSWTAPTENIDGTPLAELVGYHIFYGTNPSQLTNTVTVAGAATTTLEISGLGQGTYYFAVVAYNSAGLDSSQSNVANQTT